MMECEICYDSFDSDDRRPLILACKCRKVMCQSCVIRRLDSTARCPYCDIRWSVRNYLSQCKEITPTDMLETLQGTQQFKEDETSQSQHHYTLGCGELRTYYEQSVLAIMRKAEEASADQVNFDHCKKKLISNNYRRG